jgi:hypothetical protein
MMPFPSLFLTTLRPASRFVSCLLVVCRRLRYFGSPNPRKSSVQAFCFTRSYETITTDQWFFRPFVTVGHTILRDVEAFSYGDPLRLLVIRLPSSWLSLHVPVFSVLPLTGAGMLISLNTSVLFCCVTSQLRISHYGPDVASWSFGPDNAFYLAASPLVGGTVLNAYFLIRFRVIYG